MITGRSLAVGFLGFPVLIPFGRFLEVRARRLQIVTELTQPAPERPINVAAASAARASDERARATVRVLATDPAAGVQRS